MEKIKGGESGKKEEIEGTITIDAKENIEKKRIKENREEGKLHIYSARNNNKKKVLQRKKGKIKHKKADEEKR